jgi:hypothetical protein
VLIGRRSLAQGAVHRGLTKLRSGTKIVVLVVASDALGK